MVLPQEKNNEVKQQVLELVELERKYKELHTKYLRKKEKLTVAIKNFMFCNKGADKSFQFQNEEFVLSVKKITPTSIVWDVDKLEREIDKEVAQEVIMKTYTIDDIDGLITYLRSCNVNPKKFKSFISIEKKVDEAKLEQLEALGTITLDDVKGCYTTKEKSSYLQVRRMEAKE